MFRKQAQRSNLDWCETERRRPDYAQSGTGALFGCNAVSMDTLLQDIRLALRRLGRRPGFAAIAVLTLALTIGANTTVFSAVSALVLRPLPVEQPGQLVSFNSVAKDATFPALSYPDYQDYRDRNTLLSGLFAYRLEPMSLSADGRNARVWGYLATGNYFDVLGVKALLGRTFQPEDDAKSGAHSVAVLTYGCWRRRFGGDPAAVGRTIRLNGGAYTIIGVMSGGFTGTEVFLAPELWIPLGREASGRPPQRRTRNYLVAGRMKPGVTRRQGQEELNAITNSLAREYPEADAGMHIQLSAVGLAGSYLRRPVVSFATALMAAAGLVLLLGCVNLAGLLLARATDRSREIAILLALGAGRKRLVRHLLAESALLAFAGGAAGLLLAMWLTDLLSAWQPPTDLPLVLNFAIDGRVLWFTAGVSLATALLAGLAPALAATRPELAPMLRGHAESGRSRRWQIRDVLVSVQVALSLVLLVGSLLVADSLRNAASVPLGFNPHGAVSLSFDLGLQGYTHAQGRAFDQRLLDRVSTLPGIVSVALVSSLPLSVDRSTNGIYLEGQAVPEAYAPAAVIYKISPGYFRTMQTRLVEGRDIDVHDRPGAPQVAVVNQAFVKRLFGNRGIGKRFRFGPGGAWITVVGVVEDGKYTSLTEDSTLAVFLPLWQSYDLDTTVVARSANAAPEVLRELRRAVLALEPAMSIYEDESLEQRLGLPLAPARLAAWALGSSGLLALVLAATGLYGVMAYAVSRRTREIGIRLALGSSRGRVARLIAERTAVVVGIGIAAGALAGLALSRFFTPILFGVSPRDPAIYWLAALLMVLVAITAGYGPARRSMRIDPLAALREE